MHTSTPFRTIESLVTQLDGFQGPDAFRAQLAADMQEMEAVKKKLGI